MKYFRNLILPITIFYIISICNSSAQEKLKPNFWYGLHGGVSFNEHNGNFNGFTGTARCGTFTNGSGTGWFLGHLVEWDLNDYIALNPRMTYSTLDGTLKAPDQFLSLLPPDYTTPTVIQTEHTLDTKFSYFAFEGLVKLSPFPIPFSLYVGAGLGVVFNRTFNQDEKVVFPPNVSFTDLKNISGDLPNSSSFRSTIIIGAGYDIFLSDNIVLAPEFMYNIPLTKVKSDADWKIASIHAGVQFKFGIPREPEPVIIPPKKEEPPPPPPPPPPPVLAVNIIAKSLDTTGTLRDVIKVIVEETQTTDMFPLLPYVFFNEGSAEVPNTLANLNQTNTSSFNITKIPRETMSLYDQVLNIIGQRMNQYSQAKLALTGYVGSTQNELNNSNLGKSRAESVKKYFTDVWKIQPERISIKTDSSNVIQTSAERDLLEQEARRVIISSDTYEVLAPIVIEDIERKVSPPVVYFIPEVFSQVGVTDWSIDVQQDKKQLKNFTGKNNIASSYEWEIEKGILPLSESPIMYSLKVNDQASQSKTVNKSIPVQQLTVKKKREERFGNIKIERYRLILFAYNSAQLGPVNERILAFIRERLAPSAMIKIDGYTDHVGLEDYNMLLSSERAKNVRTGLGNTIADDRITLRANGESDLFDNAKPEGRYFCRTVYITVETPSE